MQITQELLEASAEVSTSSSVQASEVSVDSLELPPSTEDPLSSPQAIEESKTVGIQVYTSKQNVRLQVLPKTSSKREIA